jgi:putative membrane protein
MRSACFGGTHFAETARINTTFEEFRMKAVYALSILSFAVASAAYADPSSTDKSFLKKAAEGGALEIQASQVAEQKSQDAQVKSFAEKMVTDHTKVGDELSSLASSKGVTVPTDPSVAQKAKLKVLSAESGAHFDKSYAKEIGVSAHKDTIALFQKEIDKGSDPDIKAFAQKTMPALQEHLQMAQQLQTETAAAK